MSLKVALLGNMNNNFFALSRYLKDLNIDVKLFIFDNEFEHFNPSADSYNNDYKKGIIMLEWGDFYTFNTSLKEKVTQDLYSYNILIGCGTAPAYMELIGRKLDIFIPYGADLFYLPFFNRYYLRHPINCFNFMLYHRKGIKNCKNIMFDKTNEIFESTLDKLNIKSNRIASTVPMVYFPQYTKNNIESFAQDSKIIKRVELIRDSVEFLIIHNSRHCWKNCKEKISIKNNHYLFYALKKLIDSKNLNGKIKLITFEYGNDYEASKTLSDSLGLNDYVEWFPLASRKELMGIINICDLVVGEFNLSWFTYGVVIEAMTLSKPIMHYRNDSLYENLYPMLNARSIDEIEKQLNYALNNRDELVQMGLDGNRWFKKYIVDSSLEKIIKIIGVGNE